MTTMLMMLSGLGLGFGVALIVRGLVTDAPDLRAALARIDSAATPLADRPAAGVSVHLTVLADRMATRLRLDRFTADLRLLGQTSSGLMLRKAGYAMLGFAFAPVSAAMFAIIGAPLPLAIPAIVSLLLAGILFFVPDVDVRRRAHAERRRMRRAVCVYLELVALERAADAGAIEALDRAAEIGDGRAFDVIRDALLRSRLGGTPPWETLRRAADDLVVPELGDVADIMRLSGEDGAAVYATLRARAAGLRTTLLTEDTTEANAASEHLVMPVAMLGLSFIFLLAYPAFARLVFD